MAPVALISSDHIAHCTLETNAPLMWGMFEYPITQNPVQAPNSCYDATNGTTSWGYIIRSNKGDYTGNND